MNRIAAALKHMLAAGMDHDSIVEVVAAMEDGRPLPAEKVYVYVIAVDHPGDVLVKVGISKHPNFRLNTLEKERGYNLYLAHLEGPFTRVLAATVERKAHDALSDQREKGEWFLCGARRAAQVVMACATGGVH